MSTLGDRKAFWPVFALFVVLVFQLVMHLMWLPLLTSVGQLTMPWLMTQGMTLYKDIRIGYNPGTAVVLAAAMRILPLEPLTALRLMDTLLVMVISVAVFWVAYQLSGRRYSAAVIAVLVWTLWEPIWGNTMFYPDKFLGLFPLLTIGCWIVTEERSSGWLAPFLAGLMLGAGFMVKQHGLAMAGLFGIWLVIFGRTRRSSLQNILAYCLGFAVLPVLAAAIIILQGNLQTYAFWAYTVHFLAERPTLPLSGDFLRRVALSEVFVPAFLLMALRNKEDRSRSLQVTFLWVGAHALVFPRWGDNNLGTQLPLTATMSGIAIASTLPDFRGFSRSCFQGLNQSQVVLLGITVMLAVTWLFTGLIAYIPNPMGRLATPGYTEFEEVASILRTHQKSGDTLGIIPESDATSQLHVHTGMLPVGNLYYQGGGIFLPVTNIVGDILGSWQQNPPTFIVYVPDETVALVPYIDPLVDFMQAHYEEVASVPDVLYHGDVFIYHLAD